MPTKREYLAGLGLAKAAGRGRFSRDALKELARATKAGITFDESTKTTTTVVKTRKPKAAARTAIEIEKTKRVRNIDTIYGIDRGRNSSQLDLIIGFSSCAACSRPVAYCTHSTPKLPEWLNSEVYLTKPEV